MKLCRLNHIIALFVTVSLAYSNEPLSSRDYPNIAKNQAISNVFISLTNCWSRVSNYAGARSQVDFFYQDLTNAVNILPNYSDVVNAGSNYQWEDGGSVADEDGRVFYWTILSKGPPGQDAGQAFTLVHNNISNTDVENMSYNVTNGNDRMLYADTVYNCYMSYYIQPTGTNSSPTINSTTAADTSTDLPPAVRAGIALGTLVATALLVTFLTLLIRCLRQNRTPESLVCKDEPLSRSTTMVKRRWELRHQSMIKVAIADQKPTYEVDDGKDPYYNNVSYPVEIYTQEYDETWHQKGHLGRWPTSSSRGFASVIDESKRSTFS